VPVQCNAPTSIALHWETRGAADRDAEHRRGPTFATYGDGANNKLVPLACDGKAHRYTLNRAGRRRQDVDENADDHGTGALAAFFAALAARFFSRISPMRSKLSTSAIDAQSAAHVLPTLRLHAEPLAEQAYEDPRLVLAEAGQRLNPLEQLLAGGDVRPHILRARRRSARRVAAQIVGALRHRPG
jgi:hypothetical protein